jgi:hypothetical protein
MRSSGLREHGLKIAVEENVLELATFPFRSSTKRGNPARPNFSTIFAFL